MSSLGRLQCVFPFFLRGDLLPTYAEKEDVALWQVQISHEARGSVCFKLKDKFQNFLKANQEAAGLPGNLEQLELDAGIRFVTATPSDNERGAVSVPWRSCFYVAGTDADCVNNFLLLLDGHYCILCLVMCVCKDSIVCNAAFFHDLWFLQVGSKTCWERSCQDRDTPAHWHRRSNRGGDYVFPQHLRMILCELSDLIA